MKLKNFLRKEPILKENEYSVFVVPENDSYVLYIPYEGEEYCFGITEDELEILQENLSADTEITIKGIAIPTLEVSPRNVGPCITYEDLWPKKEDCKIRYEVTLRF